MSRPPRTIWNIAANTTGTVVNMVSGLVVMPYLIRTLGSGTYGLWILIGTLTGYFGVLDLGISAALGRLIAAHRARGAHENVNVLMSTACALLLVVCVVVCLATCAVLVVFPHLFNVPAERLWDVRFSIILVGLNLALTFPASVFAGFLWSRERFDLQNAVDVPALTLRTVLSLTAVSALMPLTSLGVITFAVNTLGNLARMVLCFRLDPNLRIARQFVVRDRIREIFAIGGWMSVISWSRTLIPQVAPTLIGARLGNTAVTTFTVGRQLVTYSNIFANSATQVMAPRAIVAFATGSVNSQTQLLLEGGRFACALTLFFGGGLLCLGMPFIHWWQHGTQDAAYVPLLILLAGESLPMSQWLTYSVLLGANRQRLLACLALVEGALTLVLVVALVRSLGIIGVCIGSAIAAFLTRGLFQWVYGCRLIGVSLATYVRRVFLPVSMLALLPVAALFAATAWLAPATFAAIVLLGALYAVLYALVLGWALLGYGRLRALVSTAHLRG
jgi:O-antigen/teichoic acid export membrane protein